MSNIPMLSRLIRDGRAWTAATLDDQSAWYQSLPLACLVAFERAVLDRRRQSRPVVSFNLSDNERRACGESLRAVSNTLEHGRGFVIITGIPVEDYSAEEIQLLYWLLGQALGRPLEQNVQGTLLYDVRDYGLTVTQGARFSVTNAESTFHTDNSFGDGLDTIGLLCLQPARTGGLSQLVSGYTVHNVLLQEHPDLLPILYQPFHIDRRGGTREGEPPTAQYPIITWDGRELTFRYLRLWIEAGQQKANRPLTVEQVRALDALDEAAHRPDLRAEFPLGRGEILLANNCWTLHNRTAFEDHPEPDRRRHLVRLWIGAFSV
jgi:hypothetical protein